MSSPNKNMIARKKELPLQDDSSNLFLQIMISIAVFLFGVTPVSYTHLTLPTT